VERTRSATRAFKLPKALRQSDGVTVAVVIGKMNATAREARAAEMQLVERMFNALFHETLASPVEPRYGYKVATKSPFVAIENPAAFSAWKREKAKLARLYPDLKDVEPLAKCAVPSTAFDPETFSVDYDTDKYWELREEARQRMIGYALAQRPIPAIALPARENGMAIR
jgi:hypothetical protein